MDVFHFSLPHLATGKDLEARALPANVLIPDDVGTKALAEVEAHTAKRNRVFFIAIILMEL